MASHEQPVFFDQTGKRWQRTKWIFALAAVATGVLLAIIVPLVTITPRQILTNGENITQGMAGI